MPCKCNCDPCWICGVRPSALILDTRLAYGDPQCCGSLLAGTYAIGDIGEAPLTSGHVWHYPFGHSGDVPGLSGAVPLVDQLLINECFAAWRFLPDSTTNIDGLEVSHLGPRCALLDDFVGNRLHTYLAYAYMWLVLGPRWIRDSNLPVPQQVIGTANTTPIVSGEAESTRIRVEILYGYTTVLEHPFNPTTQSTINQLNEWYYLDLPKPCRDIAGNTYEIPFMARQNQSLGNCQFDEDPIFNLEVEF